MDPRVEQERDRLLWEAAALIDKERRAPRFVLLFVAAFIATAISTIVPSHEKLWGNTTWAQSFCFLGFAIVSILGSTIIYSQVGPKNRLYEVAEAIEVTALTGQASAFAYTAGEGALVFWLMHLLGPLFWAQVKPAYWQRYGLLSLTTCLVSGVLCWRDGRTNTAVLALFVGVSTAVVAAWVARARLRTFILEAERNVTKVALSELRQETERQALARELETELGEDLRTLADELEHYEPTRGEATTARQIAVQLENLWIADAACSASELARRIEEKCRPLCARMVYDQTGNVDEAHIFDAATATALLRIAQELVRNAATHSGGRRVSLSLVVDATGTTLCVHDDGMGLLPDKLAGSQGGLDNAARRLHELGGTLAVAPTARGTELVARLNVALCK